MSYPNRCDTCGEPGGETSCTRRGVVIWRRVFCDDCFRRWRVDLQTDGKTLIPKGQA